MEADERHFVDVRTGDRLDAEHEILRLGVDADDDRGLGLVESEDEPAVLQRAHGPLVRLVALLDGDQGRRS